MPYKTDVTDAQFERVRVFLAFFGPGPRPGDSPSRGRPRSDDRKLLDGILWRLDNGAKWRAIPAEYGPWSTVYARWRTWTDTGVWEKIIEALQADLNEEDRIDLDFAAMDGTIVRAHKCAAGAPKEDEEDTEQSQQRQGLGYSRGGLSTKIHVVCDGRGVPMGSVLTGGQRHETTRAKSLLETIRLEGAAGEDSPRFAAISGDKGYDAGHVRQSIEEYGAKSVIPRRGAKVSEQKGDFDRAAYKKRNVVERLIGRIKEHRAVATRYEKLVRCYHAFVRLAFILILLKAVS